METEGYCNISTNDSYKDIKDFRESLVEMKKAMMDMSFSGYDVVLLTNGEYEVLKARYQGGPQLREIDRLMGVVVENCGDVEGVLRRSRAIKLEGGNPISLSVRKHDETP